MEGIVIRSREVRKHLELHVRRLGQGERNLHLPGGSIRRSAEVLGAVVRPLDSLAAGGRRIVHHHKGREKALTGEALQFDRQALPAARAAR